MDKGRSSFRQSSLVAPRSAVSFDLGSAFGKWWPMRSALTSEKGLRSLLGLALVGCSGGASLDTPYEEYVPAAAVVDANSNTVSSSTTGGGAACDDSTVNEAALLHWCSGVPCHGEVGSNNGKAPLWLFAPTRSTDFLNQPALTPGCGDELIIDTADPEASALITSLRGTSPCGLEMPKLVSLDVPEQKNCIEAWALGLAGAD